MVNDLAKKINDNSSLSLFDRFIGFDDMFDRFFGDSWGSSLMKIRNSYPPYNLVSTDNGYDLEVAVAGYDKNEISITNDNGVLTIEANKVEETEEDKTNYLHRGIAKRQFKISYQLSDEVVIDGAEMKDGMLRVNMTKVEPEKNEVKQIEIK